MRVLSSIFEGKFVSDNFVCSETVQDWPEITNWKLVEGQLGLQTKDAVNTDLIHQWPNL